MDPAGIEPALPADQSIAGFPGTALYEGGWRPTAKPQAQILVQRNRFARYLWRPILVNRDSSLQGEDPRHTSEGLLHPPHQRPPVRLTPQIFGPAVTGFGIILFGG